MGEPGAGRPIRALLVDDEPLVRRGLRGFLADEPDVVVAGECRDGTEALAAIRAERPDLVFLDVQMPELDGVSVLAALEPAERPRAVVFVTAFDEYALRAFDLHAVDYLLKPFGEERFRTALARARERLRRATALDPNLAALLAELRPEPPPADRLVVRTAGRVVLVPTEAIDWIEAADNYVRIHAGGERHVLRETIRSLELRLDPRHFVRIHRSTIVNLDRVRELRALPSGDFDVLLGGGVRLTLSRTYRDRLERRLGRPL